MQARKPAASACPGVSKKTTRSRACLPRRTQRPGMRCPSSARRSRRDRRRRRRALSRPASAVRHREELSRLPHQTQLCTDCDRHLHIRRYAGDANETIRISRSKRDPVGPVLNVVQGASAGQDTAPHRAARQLPFPARWRRAEPFAPRCSCCATVAPARLVGPALPSRGEIEGLRGGW